MTEGPISNSGRTGLGLVLRSVNSPDGILCVDLFRRTDGTCGFELYRRDPEDSRWFAIGAFAAGVYPDAASAWRGALQRMDWLAEDASSPA